jgi:magnesium chelatase family protein
MTVEESLESAYQFHLGYAATDVPLIQTRPFRAPHHTISHAGWWAAQLAAPG